MSMYGAVDLSTLAPRGGQNQPAAGGGTEAPVAAAGQVLPAPLVVELTAQNLQDVAQVSTQAPVVLVVYSPRSAASVQLTELLERLAGEYEGRFELAKVDGDAHPQVAQALQVRAVPTVMALLAGQPVPMFTGEITEDQLRGLLDQVLQVAAQNGVTARVQAGPVSAQPSQQEETETERAAREAIERGDYAAAIEVYDHAIANNPADDDLKVARDQVRMMARMDGQDPHALLAAADANPTDVEAALAGADAALALGDVNAALGRALEAVRSHTGEERETARKRLLELFDVIGTTSPEVARARRQLATLLF